MQFEVHNPGPGTRHVQVAGGAARRGRPGVSSDQQRPVRPGETITVSMRPAVALRFMQASAANPKYLQIKPADDEAREAVSGRDSTEVVGQTGQTEGQPAGQQPSGRRAETARSTGEGGTSDAAKELLTRAGDMEIEKLRTEARMILGQRWPRRGGAELTRDQIVELLKQPAPQE